MLEDFRRYWHNDQDELQLLIEWAEPDQSRRLKLAAGGAVLWHVFLILFALNAPSSQSICSDMPSVSFAPSGSTVLVAPPLEEIRELNRQLDQLTQKAANQKKVAAELDLAGLLPKPAINTPANPSPGVPQSKQFQLPQPSAPVAAKVLEAPSLDTEKVDLAAAAPPPQGIQIQPVERPKLALEGVGGPQASSTSGSSPILRPQVETPKPGISEAVRGAARSAGRGTVVGDAGTGLGDPSDPLRQRPSGGKNASQLELLSDPLGVDFRPYLIQVLASVRRNWFAVMPESVRFGRSGKVAIQFAISRDGRVPKLVIASPSGTDALDRAAVAGVSASNPFPPLPPEFKGEQVRLQLVFSYNIPK